MGSGMNEAAMLGALLPLLPGEALESALYCGYKGTGFFSSGRNIVPGYIGITDRDRLVGQRTGLLGNVEVFSEEFKDLKKLKLSGALFGQKQVYFLFLGEKKRELKIQIAPKIYGDSFPGQEKNFRAFLDRLEEKRAALPN